MGVFEELKSIGRVLQEAGKIDLYQKILEVQSNLLEYQKEIADLKNQNIELMEKLRMKGKLVYDSKEKAYFSEEDSERNSPFCPNCWENDNRTIHLSKYIYHDSIIHWKCPKCLQTFPYTK